MLTNTGNVDNTIAFFLVTQDSLEVIQQDINPEEFNNLVTSYRNQLADYQNPDVYVTSIQLYQLLITPIEAEIKAQSPQRLAIIATGNLRYIPFETLLNEQTKEFLLQTYPIHYLTRISSSRLIENINYQLFKNILPLGIIAAVVTIGGVYLVIIRKFRIVSAIILIVIVGGMTFFFTAKPQSLEKKTKLREFGVRNSEFGINKP